LLDMFHKSLNKAGFLTHRGLLETIGKEGGGGPLYGLRKPAAANVMSSRAARSR
jgi:hypothetical protein